MIMKKLIYSAVIIISAVTLFSCNSKKDKKEESKTAIECKKDDKSVCCTKSLQGEWIVASVKGKAINPADSVFIGFDIKDNKIYGMTGCNRLMGEFKVSDDYKLSFDKLGSTKMACPKDKEDVEKEVLAALPEVKEFKIGECTDSTETVSLLDKDKKEIFVLNKKLTPPAKPAVDQTKDSTKTQDKDTTKSKDAAKTDKKDKKK